MKIINDFIRDCKECYKSVLGNTDFDEKIVPARDVEDATREYKEKKERKLDKKLYVLQQYFDVYDEKFHEMVSINNEINKNLKRDTAKIRKMQYDGADPSFVMWDNLIKRQDNTEITLLISEMVSEANYSLADLFSGLDDDAVYNEKLENLEGRTNFIDHKIDSMKKYFDFSFEQANPAVVPYLFALMEKPVET